jgi:hypothetical protein
MTDEQEQLEVYLLVNAVSVEPVAAATSFAWNGSMVTVGERFLREIVVTDHVFLFCLEATKSVENIVSSANPPR